MSLIASGRSLTHTGESMAKTAGNTRNERGVHKEFLRFDIDTSLLLQLGEDLVTKRSVAMGELVKNAYDADATQVIIEFRDISTPGGQITILDDGCGIALGEIQGKWMRIGTRDKVENPVSPRFGRPKAGAKGIGRFATRRLAEELELVSTAWKNPKRQIAGKEETTIAFHWTKDFSPGKDLSSVRVTCVSRDVPKDTPPGLLLRLEGVRDAWTAEDVNELRRDLVRLISPLPKPTRKRKEAEERDPGFDINFKFVDVQFDGFSGSLANDFLEHAYATLEGNLTANGKPTYSLRFSDDPSKRQPAAYIPSDTRFGSVGQATFKVHLFVYKRDYLGGAEFGVHDAQRIGREHGGVQINYDGFRVPPYGDRGDDWLSLDADRGRRISDPPIGELRALSRRTDRPMLLLPGNNQVFGQVGLSRLRNPDLCQLANREGFRENEAFRQLRSFVRLGVNWLTVMYARHTEEKRRKNREAKRDGERTPTGLLQQARRLIDTLPEEVSTEQRKEASQAIDLAIEAIEEQEADQIGELQMLRVLASTGTMIVVFDHQLLGILQGLRQSYRDLRSFIRSIPAQERRRFSETLGQLEGWIADAKHQSELIGLLLSTRSRTRKRRVAIHPVVEKIRQAFSNYTKTNGIDLDNAVPKTARTPPMFECELSAILINLLTNSMKAVKPKTERKISINAKQSTADVMIRVSDNGIGAEKSKWQEYFRPFVSESEPDPILGTGTGLGLKIVADFVDVYGGHAKFVEADAPWTTCVEIRIPE